MKRCSFALKAQAEMAVAHKLTVVALWLCAPLWPMAATGAECPAIENRISENAICDPDRAKTKQCDAKYRAASPEWVACYREVADCRRQVTQQNSEISKRNTAAYECQGSLLAARRKQKVPLAAHAAGTISPIRQSMTMGCWATVATMMQSWKNNRSETIEAVLAQLDPSFRAKYEKNEGLDGSEKAEFLSAMKLKAEAPQNYTADGWRKLIEQYGPLWITTNEGSETSFSIHARILTGIFGDGSPDNTTVVVVDPADGALHTESLKTFDEKFESVARIDLGTTSGEIRPQVVHY